MIPLRTKLKTSRVSRPYFNRLATSQIDYPGGLSNQGFIHSKLITLVNF